MPRAELRAQELSVSLLLKLTAVGWVTSSPSMSELLAGVSGSVLVCWLLRKINFALSDALACGWKLPWITREPWPSTSVMVISWKEPFHTIIPTVWTLSFFEKICFRKQSPVKLP